MAHMKGQKGDIGVSGIKHHAGIGHIGVTHKYILTDLLVLSPILYQVYLDPLDRKALRGYLESLDCEAEMENLDYQDNQVTY